MVYRALGIMSGSSLDGLDMALVEFHEVSGKWSYEVTAAACYPYSAEWTEKLRNATSLNALQYQLLHTSYGQYIGEQVNRFINEKQLQYQVQLISSHGHTTFHVPAQKMTAQLGDGAAIAAATGINVVSDLRAMDVALGGQGAPIVPIGEKLLLGEYDMLLNLGGIANISVNHNGKYIAFDIAPANRVLNMLAAEAGKEYDENGTMAAAGEVQPMLLQELNALPYYRQSYPKSLANDFGTDIVYPLLRSSVDRIRKGGYWMESSVAGNDWVAGALRTYVEHIVIQVRDAIKMLSSNNNMDVSGKKLLATGGGAHNSFLIERLRHALGEMQVELVVPSAELINYKEAIVMALIGVLRWRENNNVLSSVTGSTRDSIGGAVWIGQEA
jgi:anhydro-N-acetylmuramic acid kinase